MRTLLHPLLFSSLLMAFASAAAAPAIDLRTFEAITGETVDDEHSAWDSFYKKKDHAFGQDAIGFLKENLGAIPKGEAFVPAMGEGRNALFLAQRGFRVVGVDLSAIAVDRAVAEAKTLKVPLRGVVADLFQYSYPREKYDFVLLSLFYSPALLPKFKQSLKKGGKLMIYLKLDNGRAKDPQAPDDFVVKPEELRAAIADLQVLTWREFRDQSNDVVGILARKP